MYLLSVLLLLKLVMKIMMLEGKNEISEQYKVTIRLLNYVAIL